MDVFPYIADKILHMFALCEEKGIVNESQL